MDGQPSQSSAKRSGAPLIGLIIGVTVAFGLCLWASWHVVMSEVSIPEEAFDAQQWGRVDRIADRYDRTRQGMQSDLLDNHLLVGPSRQQDVVRLLGAPERGMVEPSYLIYWLGPGRKRYLDLDSEWLHIRIGARGRVTDISIVRR